MAPIEPGAIRVLLTGFGPFNQYKVNPSWLAARVLNDTTLYVSPSPFVSGGAAPQPVHITAMELPTVYTSVLATVPGYHARPPVLPPVEDPEYAVAPPPADGYDFVMHCGVAGPQPLRLERQGHKTGYNSPDASGQMCEEVPGAPGPTPVRGFGKGYEEMPEEMKTELDVDALLEYLNAAGVEGSWISTDAGHYLCDFTYYCSLAQAKLAQERAGEAKPRPVFFLHLPPIGEPMSTEQVTDGIKKIILWVSAQLAQSR